MIKSNLSFPDFGGYVLLLPVFLFLVILFYCLELGYPFLE